MDPRGYHRGCGGVTGLLRPVLTDSGHPWGILDGSRAHQTLFIIPTSPRGVRDPVPKQGWREDPGKSLFLVLTLGSSQNRSPVGPTAWAGQLGDQIQLGAGKGRSCWDRVTCGTGVGVPA